MMFILSIIFFIFYFFLVIDCDYYNMNFGFMVDGFVIVEFFGEGNFNKFFEFVVNFIVFFDVFDNVINFGMVVFFEDFYLVFNFLKYKNFVDVIVVV